MPLDLSLPGDRGMTYVKTPWVHIEDYEAAAEVGLWHEDGNVIIEIAAGSDGLSSKVSARLDDEAAAKLGRRLVELTRPAEEAEA